MPPHPKSSHQHQPKSEHLSALEMNKNGIKETNLKKTLIYSPPTFLSVFVLEKKIERA